MSTISFPSKNDVFISVRVFLSLIKSSPSYPYLFDPAA